MPVTTNVKTKKSKANKEAVFGDSPWHISNFFRSIDRYGQNVPAFNIKGASVIRTSIGGILTGIVITLTLVYFIVKLQALIDRSDPIIN